MASCGVAWRASQIPDTGPNNVRIGTEGSKCQNDAGSTRLSLRMKRQGWWWRLHPIAEVAREIHVNEGTLGNWVTKYRVANAGEEPPLSITERARLRELEKAYRWSAA